MFVNIKEQPVGKRCRATTIFIHMTKKRANWIVGNAAKEEQIDGRTYCVFHNAYYYYEGCNERRVLVDFAQCINFKKSSSNILHTGGNEATLLTNSGWYYHIDDVLIPKKDIIESLRQLRDKIYQTNLKEKIL